MFNYRQIADDFRQKYEGTFLHVRVNEKATPELFYLAEVRHVSDKEPPELTLVNSKVGEIQLKYTTECDVEFLWPSPGYFWHRGAYAVLFQRPSSRQWKRGISSANCKLLFPYSLWYPANIAVNEESLREAFNPTYVTLTDAEAFIKNAQAVSVPLSSSLALGASPSSKVGGSILWCFGKPIGLFTAGKIVLMENQFAQEVRDYLRDTGTYAEIV